jgi:hypothetical protein
MRSPAKILQDCGVKVSSLRLLFEDDAGPVYGLSVPCRRALDVWSRLRELVPQTGCWPVLLGLAGDEDVPTQRKVYNTKTKKDEPQKFPTTAEILKKVQALDGARWFKEAHEKHVKFLKEELAECLAKGYEEDAAHYREKLKGPARFRGLPRDDWPDEEGGILFEFACMDLVENEGNRAVGIGLLPTEVSWQAPAVLKLGKWNACPPPHEHVAILGYWHERYGAEVVRISDGEGIVETAVARPPATRAKALALAKEQYLYCADIVDQGTDSIDALAAQLLDGERWYFWWD